MTDLQKSGERVAQWRDFVAERLGREPRGFRDVELLAHARLRRGTPPWALAGPRGQN